MTWSNAFGTLLHKAPILWTCSVHQAPSSDKLIPFWYIFQKVPFDYIPVNGILFLIIQVLLCFENVLRERKVQSTLHLWISLVSGLIVLWSSVTGSGELCTVSPGKTAVTSFAYNIVIQRLNVVYLQTEKQEHEEAWRKEWLGHIFLTRCCLTLLNLKQLKLKGHISQNIWILYKQIFYSEES